MHFQPTYYFVSPFFVCRREIEECRSCECDRLRVDNNYNFLSWGGFCGRNTPNYEEYYFQQVGPEEENGRNIYIRFVSDDTVHYKGFNMSFVVRSDICKC